MSISAEGPNLEEFANRLAELERANASLNEELRALQAEHAFTGSQLETSVQARATSSSQNAGKLVTNRKHRSRRRLLKRGLGIAAAATVGAGVLFEASTGTALANGTEGPTTFNNNGGSTPAVTAISTNSQNAIKGTSSGFTGIAGFTNKNSNTAAGVYGQGPAVGVSGQVNGAVPTPPSKVAVYGTGSKGSTLGGIGVQGDGDSNHGVVGTSISKNGVMGTSKNYTGVAGFTNNSSNTAAGVYGQGPAVGVSGQVNGAVPTPPSKVAIYGTGSNGSSLGGIGVQGDSDNSYGVVGNSISNYGVVGSGARGVFGSSTSDIGVLGESDTYVGIWGQAIDTGYSGTGIVGSAPGATTLSPGYVGVYGTGSNGSSNGGVGVYGEGDTGYGVIGYCPDQYGWGVAGEGDEGVGVGVYADGATGVLAYGYPTAGEFEGDVYVSGNLTKGGGSFKIDHPLDPANKYLYHSFVESPDMKNVYDGVVTLDANGEATVTLPSWFEALNTDFRYLLTSIGAAAPNLHVAGEISNLSFKIAGGTAGMKVCWQVTGIRQDVWARANRIPVEQDKSASARGHYLYPKLYGHSSDPSIMELPYVEKVKRLKKLHK